MKNARKFIDLHVHLDGAITLDIAKKLFLCQNIKLPMDDCILEKKLRVSKNCSSLIDFLSCFELPVSLMQTYEAIQEAAFSVAENMRMQGVVYCEIRFAPQLHTKKGLTQYDVVNAVLRGVKKSSLKTNIILCCMRGDKNAKENIETVEITRQHLVNDGGVVALDLAGAESLFNTANFRELFVRAKKYDIPFTIHAGEADGPESVRLAIEYGAKRIGHGVRAIESKNVLQMIVDKCIPLEMCPTSNLQTAAISDMSKYPFIDYLNEGVKVTINTDDPAIEGTDISKEFIFMKEYYGLTDEQEKTVLSNAVDAAFTTDYEKNRLRSLLNI